MGQVAAPYFACHTDRRARQVSACTRDAPKSPHRHVRAGRPRSGISGPGSLHKGTASPVPDLRAVACSLFRPPRVVGSRASGSTDHLQVQPEIAPSLEFSDLANSGAGARGSQRPGPRRIRPRISMGIKRWAPCVSHDGHGCRRPFLNPNEKRGMVVDERDRAAD